MKKIKEIKSSTTSNDTSSEEAKIPTQQIATTFKSKHLKQKEEESNPSS